MKYEFETTQRILVFTLMVLVLAIVGANPLVTDDIQLAIPVLFGRMAFSVAVACFLLGRQVRQGAIVCPAPCDDLQILLSVVRAFLAEYGYRELDTRSPHRWAFAAERFVKGHCRPVWIPARTVSIEVAGPACLRVEGSSALLRQLRKRIAGAVDAPYTGPQPWISRYMGLPCIGP
jgi:hypothetical protein